MPIFCCFIIQSGVVFWIHVDQISHANGASSALVAQSCLQSFGFVFNNGGFVDYRNTFQFLKQFPKFDLEALVVWLGPATTQQAEGFCQVCYFIWTSLESQASVVSADGDSGN